MDLDDEVWDAYALVSKGERNPEYLEKVDMQQRSEKVEPLDFEELHYALRESFIDRIENVMEKIPRQFYAIVSMLWMSSIVPVSLFGVYIIKNEVIFTYEVPKRNLFLLFGIVYYLFSFMVMFISIRHFTRREQPGQDPSISDAGAEGKLVQMNAPTDDEKQDLTKDEERPFRTVRTKGMAPRVLYPVSRSLAVRMAGCIIGVMGFGVVPFVQDEVDYVDGYYQYVSAPVSFPSEQLVFNTGLAMQYVGSNMKNELGIRLDREGQPAKAQLCFNLASKGDGESIAALANRRQRVVGTGSEPKEKIKDTSGIELIIQKDKEEELGKIERALATEEYIDEIMVLAKDTNTLAVALAEEYPRISGLLFDETLKKEGALTAEMNENLEVLGLRSLRSQGANYVTNVKDEERIINPGMMATAQSAIVENSFSTVVELVKSSSDLDYINSIAVSYEKQDRLFEAATIYSFGRHKNYLDLHTALNNNYQRFLEGVESRVREEGCFGKKPFRSSYLLTCADQRTADPATQHVLGGAISDGLKMYSTALKEERDNEVALFNYLNVMQEINVYNATLLNIE